MTDNYTGISIYIATHIELTSVAEKLKIEPIQLVPGNYGLVVGNPSVRGLAYDAPQMMEQLLLERQRNEQQIKDLLKALREIAVLIDTKGLLDIDRIGRIVTESQDRAYDG